MFLLYPLDGSKIKQKHFWQWEAIKPTVVYYDEIFSLLQIVMRTGLHVSMYSIVVIYCKNQGHTFGSFSMVRIWKDEGVSSDLIVLNMNKQESSDQDSNRL